LTLKTFNRSRDGFLFIDGDPYLISASLKDLEKKRFVFSGMRPDANVLLQNIIRENKAATDYRKYRITHSFRAFARNISIDCSFFNC
jgi:hypothetical protein